MAVSGTLIVPRQIGTATWRHEATLNGVTVRVDAPSQLALYYESVALPGKTGLVVRDSTGEPMRYVLRDL